jgi:hypothetical protein
MEKAFFPELRNIPIPREYRIHHGKIEARILDGRSIQEQRWTEVSSEQLSSHVLRNTDVARWLERNLGWRRLLRACVGIEPDGQVGRTQIEHKQNGSRVSRSRAHV